jgi:transmembrane sensor
MDKRYFIQVLNKYLEGKATKTELQFILSYYNLFESEPEVLKLMTESRKDEIRDSIEEGLWKNIINAEKAPVRHLRTPVWKITAGIAAAAAVAFFTFRLVIWTGTPAKSKQSTNVSFIRNSNHMIALPDGSTVTVAAGSEVNFPRDFGTSGKREVFLEGQAFFDVRHDTSRPFIVHAGKVNVTVLGTAFNVKAFSGESDITVTVKRGKVRVSDPLKTLGTITPLQQIVYNKRRENSIQQSVNSEKYLEWRKMDCLFDNLTIAEVAGLLEDRFNITIDIDKEAASTERFTATFPQNQSLEEALNSICEFNGVQYKYDKEKGVVLITKK